MGIFIAQEDGALVTFGSHCWCYTTPCHCCSPQLLRSNALRWVLGLVRLDGAFFLSLTAGLFEHRNVVCSATFTLHWRRQQQQARQKIWEEYIHTHKSLDLSFCVSLAPLYVTEYEWWKTSHNQRAHTFVSTRPAKHYKKKTTTRNCSIFLLLLPRPLFLFTKVIKVFVALANRARAHPTEYNTYTLSRRLYIIATTTTKKQR